MEGEKRNCVYVHGMQPLKKLNVQLKKRRRKKGGGKRFCKRDDEAGPCEWVKREKCINS